MESGPKTAKGRRTIAIAPVVMEALRGYRRHQREETGTSAPAGQTRGLSSPTRTVVASTPTSSCGPFSGLPGVPGCRSSRSTGSVTGPPPLVSPLGFPCWR